MLHGIDTRIVGHELLGYLCRADRLRNTDRNRLILICLSRTDTLYPGEPYSGCRRSFVRFEDGEFPCLPEEPLVGFCRLGAVISWRAFQG